MKLNTKPHSIRIDLNQFKLHIDLKKRIALTLHFNSPSRRFYLSVIAFVVSEMKRLGTIVSIPLEEHLDLVAFLNESVGGSAGSSEKENLLPRIYRKWKDALPNLEEAPLFKVLGRRKEYDEGMGKTYLFTEEEKDGWANLFEYKGSEEKVRLRFAIDKIGAGLDDVAILYEDSTDGDAWERFLLSLKGKVEKVPPAEPIQAPSETPATPASPPEKKGMTRKPRHRWILVAALVVVLGAGTLAIWQFFFKPPPLKSASMERMSFPLPDIPSIAVLPFVDMSDDPKQEFFADGLTEEIITTLSRSPDLFVIARSSTFAYKGRPIRVDRVAEELGVRYVLEGSARRSGGKVRISVQLIDAVRGHHLWAEGFDREIKEILTVQDEIAFKIMKTLHVKLQPAQSGSDRGRGATSVEAYLKSMEARKEALRYSKDGNARAQKLFEEVIALDPNYARGYSGLAISCAAEVWLGTSKSPRDSLARAIQLGRKAVSLDESDATAQAVLAYLLAMTRQYDQAVSQAERALALDPNSYSVINNCGLALAYSGKPEEALPLLQRAVRLNPSIAQSFVMSSMAYRIAGRYDEAREEAKKAVERDPGSLLAQVARAATCILTGHEEEACAAAGEVLKINPKFSVEQYRRALPFKDPRQVDLMADALRKAGLP